MHSYYWVVGIGGIALAGVFTATMWLDTSAPASTPPTASTSALTAHGVRAHVMPPERDLQLTALAPWQVLAADALTPTFVTGYTVRGDAAQFASERRLHLSFPQPRADVPIVWYKHAGTRLPVETVRYDMGDAGVRGLSFSLYGPGRYYLLAQHQHHATSSLLQELTLTSAPGDTYAGTFRYSPSAGAVPIGHTDTHEIGLPTPIPAEQFTLTRTSQEQSEPVRVRTVHQTEGTRQVAFTSSRTCAEVVGQPAGELVLTLHGTGTRAERLISSWSTLATAPAWERSTSTPLNLRYEFAFDSFAVCDAAI